MAVGWRSSPIARRTTIRPRSLPTAGSWSSSRTRGGGTPISGPGSANTPGEGVDVRPGRRLPARVVPRRTLDRVLLRPRQHLPFAHGRWEHLQLADLYVIRPDGSGLTRITARRLLRQPEMDGRQPPRHCLLHGRGADARDPAPVAAAGQRHAPRVDRRRDRARDAKSAPVQASSSIRRSCRDAASATSARTRPTSGIYYTDGLAGRRGPCARRRGHPTARASPSTSGFRPRRRSGRRSGAGTPDYEMTLTGILPAFSPSGDRFVDDRPAASGSDPRIEHRGRRDRHERRHRHLSGQEPQRPGAAVVSHRRQDHFRCWRVQRVLQRLQRPDAEARTIGPRAARRSPSSIPTAADSGK